jgi:ABC-type bacteriocin/lantibiotic exporter with double-glycine peptidase domain
MFSVFLKNFKLVNTIPKSTLLTLGLFFLISSIIDLIGLSLIGPYVQSFFYNDLQKNNNLFFGFIVNLFKNQDIALLILTIVMITTFILRGLVGFYVVKNIIFYSFIEQAKLLTQLSDIFLIGSINEKIPKSKLINDFFYNIRIYIEQTLMSLLRLSAELILVLGIIIFLLFNYFEFSMFVIFFMVSAIFFYNKIIKKRIISYGQLSTTSSENLIEDVQNMMNGIREISLYSKQAFFSDRIKKNSYTQMINSSLANAYTQLPKYFFDVFFVNIFIIFLYFGKNYLSQKELIGVISVYGFALYRLFPSLFQISVCITNLRFSYPHLLKIAKLKEQIISSKYLSEEKNENLEKNFSIEKIRVISLKNINLKYDKNSILNDFNIDLSIGDKIYITGDSGSGKTSVVDILCGFRKEFSGAIYINEQRLDKNNHDSFARKNISYCGQLPFVTRGTILENITMFGENIDKKKLEFAITASCLDEFINKNQLSMSHEMTDLGKNLSGGERQRIQVARCLYFEKPVIIFDESTSAMEINLEKRILENMKTFLINKLFIFISHRTTYNNFFNKSLNIK